MNQTNEPVAKSEIAKDDFFIYINAGVTIDVREHYRKVHKMNILPTTPTMSGSEIRAYDDAFPPRCNYFLVWDEPYSKKIELFEAVKLFNGMTFIFVPPATY